MNYCTGIKLTEEDFVKTGERIWNLIRLYNLREGWTQDFSRLPKKFRKPLPDGLMAGHFFTEGHEEKLLKLYNKARKWDKKGVPLKSKIDELDIKIK